MDPVKLPRASSPVMEVIGIGVAAACFGKRNTNAASAAAFQTAFILTTFAAKWVQ